ncbi:MAG: hypothetical protein JNG83_14020 [Opitutaceae bacterium]|nr:hypothetical protein [Opitutaceae bacterium]
MTPPFRITLIQLTADASAVGSAADKIEHGQHGFDEVVRLAGKLQQLDLSAHPKAEPGIIVQRSDKSWRIAVHQGRLRVHKSVSLFDDFWTAATAADLGQLPPFRTSSSSTASPMHHTSAAPKRFQTLRAVAEVAGLFVLALGLVAVGLRFGLPQKRLSDVPPDVKIISSPEESAAIFAAVAGSYATGRGAGNSLITITPDGQVSRGYIGKDGKPTAPNLQEKARAGRRGNVAVVVTSSFGVIAGIAPPDVVKIRETEWKKAALQ